MNKHFEEELKHNDLDFYIEEQVDLNEMAGFTTASSASTSASFATAGSCASSVSSAASFSSAGG
ncbi:thiocillin family RiPP [Saccharibacillus sacchari]|uniref:Thiocillin family RiPP n=1 Tax=Saccharibacillus sacchari TaxID=456493 RepID=A0ACC6P9A3_9BACL